MFHTHIIFFTFLEALYWYETHKKLTKNKLESQNTSFFDILIFINVYIHINSHCLWIVKLFVCTYTNYFTKITFQKRINFNLILFYIIHTAFSSFTYSSSTAHSDNLDNIHPPISFVFYLLSDLNILFQYTTFLEFIYLQLNYFSYKKWNNKLFNIGESDEKIYNIFFL